MPSHLCCLPCDSALPVCHCPAAPARELLPCPVSQPSTPTLRNPTSHSSRTFHPHPTRFLLLSRLTFPHSPYSLSIHLSFPHWPSPILATISSTACVLKRFPLTSPRKLALPCVKRGFLRTAEPHGTSQLSPCALLMSKCHVHAVPGSDVPCPCTTAPSAPPARELSLCPVS